MKKNNALNITITLFTTTFAIAALTGCNSNDAKTTEQTTKASIEVTTLMSDSPTTSEIEILVGEDTSEMDSNSTNTVDTSNVIETETTTQSEVTTVEEETTSNVENPTGFSYTELAVVMYAKSSVNVRSGPSVDNARIGGLSKGQEVEVTGQCNETGWYRIKYNDGEGFVSGDYLIGEKPETSNEPVKVEPEDLSKYMYNFVTYHPDRAQQMEELNYPDGKILNEMTDRECPYELYTPTTRKYYFFNVYDNSDDTIYYIELYGYYSYNRFDILASIPDDEYDKYVSLRMEVELEDKRIEEEHKEFTSAFSAAVPDGFFEAACWANNYSIGRVWFWCYIPYH